MLSIETSLLTGSVSDSAARLRGLETDLHLKGQEFATLLSILYVGYILMQIPSWVLYLCCCENNSP